MVAKVQCPNCRQQIAHLTGQGACPSCGAPVYLAQREVTILRVLGSAFFASVLVCAGLVVFMVRLGYQAPGAAPMLNYIFVGIAVGELGMMVLIERALLAQETVRGVTGAAIVLAAMAESIAILGVAVFFVNGALDWFVALLALSVAGFLYLATRVPGYGRLLQEYALREQ